MNNKIIVKRGQVKGPGDLLVCLRAQDKAVFSCVPAVSLLWSLCLVVKNHLDDGAHQYNGQYPSRIQSPTRIVKWHMGYH